MVKGFRCSLTDENVSFDECVKCSEAGVLPCKLTTTYLQLLSSNLTEEHSFPSVSVLTNCPRQLFFTRKNDVFVKPSDMYYMFRGTMIHGILSKLKEDDPEAMVEQPITVKLSNYSLSGRIDYYKKGHLVDYKNISEIYYKGGKAMYLPKPAHIQQVSLYAWGLTQAGEKIEKVSIEYYSPSDMVQCDIPLKDVLSEKYLKLAELQLNKILTAINTDTAPKYQNCISEFEWMCEKYCVVKDICMKHLKKGGE